MAECFRRAADRIDPTGVFGPCHCAQPETSETALDELFRLLPSIENALGFVQGRAHRARRAANKVALDFFTVPTISFRILYVFVVLAHERRRVVHFNVTANPTAFWTGQQMIEAFPEDTTPRYLLRDRDGIYGHEFRQRVEGMGVKEVLTAPQSPWQNAFAERLIGESRDGRV